MSKTAQEGCRARRCEVDLESVGWVSLMAHGDVLATDVSYSELRRAVALRTSSPLEILP